MRRFLVVTWDGAGNLLSTLGIVERLVHNGHDVRMLGHRSIERRAGTAGARFRPFVHTAEFDSTVPFDQDDELAVLGRDLWFSANVATDVREELEREPADVVVGDAMLLGALSAAQAAGVPTVALFHSPFSGFRGGPMIDMLAPHIPALNALRDDLGLPPVSGMADVHDACALSLVATPREFEMDMPLPANVRFIGPVLDGPTLAKDADDLAVEDGPGSLLLVSFSTSYQAQTDVLQRVVTALGELDARVIVTTGPAIDPKSIEAEPNTLVTQFADHRRLLPRATAVVTHAGLGTVMTALSHGVPLLCMPMGRDQFFNAMTVERLGAGRTIPMDSASAAIVAAAQALLDDSACRVAAKNVAGTIAAYGGAADAVRELEQLAG